MSNQEDLEQGLESELASIEALRRRYLQQHPAAWLQREDPDVKRLMEAMALFALRTRAASLRNLDALWQRLIGSYFDYLLEPLPSMAMLQAEPTPRLVEPGFIERGAEVRLSPLGDQSQQGVFCTQADLRYLPLQMQGLQIIERPAGARLLLVLRSRFPRTDAVGLLRLLVWCAAGYASSLRLHYALRSHLQRATVVYDELADAHTSGQLCGLSFGLHSEQEAEADVRNPLCSVREFFHFPQQELFVNLQVPRATRPWSRCTLCLDLDPDWQIDPLLRPEVLHLYCTPMSNLRTAESASMSCDGTSYSHPIEHPEPDGQFSLQSVRGVYRMSEKGLVPLQLAAIAESDDEDVYELEAPSKSGGEHRLLVRNPSAAARRQKLVVQARWHQPWFARAAVGRLAVSLPYRSTEGADFTVLGEVCPAAEVPRRHELSALLQILSLRMRPISSQAELLQVLRALGAADSTDYRRLLPRIKELQHELLPERGRSAAGVRRHYRLAMAGVEPEEEALLWTFLGKVGAVLAAWSPDTAVELEVQTGGTSLSIPVAAP